MRKYLILFLTLLLLGILAVLTLSGNHAAPATEAGKPGASDNVPAVDAEITIINPAPDYSCVALYLKRDGAGEGKSSLAIFDPEQRRILAEMPAPNGLGELNWSADGQWIAAPSEGNKISLFSKGGETRTLQASIKVLEMYWRGDQPARLVYVSDSPREDPPALYEMDTATGKERKLRLPAEPLSFFMVQGKPCIAYRKTIKEGQDYHTLHIAQADPWRELFALPLSESAGWDISRFEVSPDGKYFYYSAWRSAGTRDIVARVQDAQLVFREPLRAVMWQDDIFGEIGHVDWLQDVNGKSINRWGMRLAVVSDEVPFVLDLETGSRKQLMWDPEARRKFRAVVLWQPFDLYPTAANRYLVLTERGLELFSDNDEPPQTLLRRQRLVEAPAQR